MDYIIRDKEVIIKAIKYNLKYPKHLTIIFITNILLIMVTSVSPLIWGEFISSLVNNEGDIKGIVALMIIVHIVQIVIEYENSMYNIRFKNIFIKDLKVNIFSDIIELPYKKFDEILPGELISRIYGDLEVLSNLVTGYIFNFMFNIVYICFIIAIMLNIDVMLTIITILVFPILYKIMKKTGLINKKRNKQLISLSDKNLNCIQETILNIKEVKSLGIKGIQKESFYNINNEIAQLDYSVQKTNITGDLYSKVVNATMYFIILIMGVFYIETLKFNISSFVAFVSYSSQINRILLQVSNTNSNIQQAIPALNRVFEIQNSKSDELQTIIEPVWNNKNEVAFRNIIFKYDKSDFVLNRISLEIAPRSKVVIVGKSGSGKTTLFNLLLRLYKPLEGEVYIGDKNINDFTEQKLREVIGVVAQEPYLFNGTIRENLQLAKKEATEEEIINACTLACIHEFVDELEDKYDTFIGEGGIKLSIGQKQRIAIARVLLKDTPIILLDEITSALDTQTEKYINKTINTISKSRTIVVIAHRLSTVLDAQQIIVMDEGEMVGSGKHEDLITNCVEYKALWEAYNTN